MVYDASDIGNYKVDAIKHRINRNFGTDVTTIKEYINSSSADKIIRRIKPDIIVYAIDPDPAFKIQFNEYCVAYGIPIIHASYSYVKNIANVSVISQEVFAKFQDRGGLYQFPLTGVEYDSPWESDNPIPEIENLCIRFVVKVQPKDGTPASYLCKTFYVDDYEWTYFQN